MKNKITELLSDNNKILTDLKNEEVLPVALKAKIQEVLKNNISIQGQINMYICPNDDHKKDIAFQGYCTVCLDRN